MITLQFFHGESKTGKKGSDYSHWYASASSGFDASGDTPLDAMTELAHEMERHIISEKGKR